MSAPELSDRLRAGGHRVTLQRRALWDGLRELGRHATADEVLRAAAPRAPGLSPPTVYATLELFEELGLVRRVATGRGAVLFDPRPDAHPHLACRACGRVEDLDAAVDAAPALAAARNAGAVPDGAALVLSGLCADCAP